MKYNYQYKVTFKANEAFDINYIKNICNRYPTSKILVEIQNTKGISSSMIRQLSSNVIIRIAGGYDDERIRRYKNQCFGNEFVKESTEDYYYNSVIYSKNETIKILEEIEKIELGLNKSWSDIQKLLYIYDRLKTSIMYDPKCERKTSSEIRSLRGLITKHTVCAGYAMILKEFMDRNGIQCEFVKGKTKIDSNFGHAWNIVTIDGKKYPIDLTWDNTTFRSGKSNSFDWLTKDILTFCKNHYPDSGEKTQDYEHTLSQINPENMKEIFLQTGIGRARDYSSTTYNGIRKDGSKFIVSQIANSKINNKNYYRYYYVEVSKDGKKGLPLILYSQTNITHLVDCKKFGKPIPPNYEYAVANILFSRENIADSIDKKTYYIGNVRKNENSNKLELISSYKEISKPEEIKNKFMYPTKSFKRSDGTVFVAQQMLKSPFKVNGIYVMRYDIFEMVNENGKDILKSNVVFTESNFFKDNRQSMVDDYLSRERLDRKVKEAGGYIGYYNENGIRIYNPNLVKFFETSKKIDIDSFDSHKAYS